MGLSFKILEIREILGVISSKVIMFNFMFNVESMEIDNLHDIRELNLPIHRHFEGKKFIFFLGSVRLSMRFI